MKRYWFKAKRYGWGWYPATIEGWICIAVYLIAILSTSILIKQFTTSYSEFSTLFTIWISVLTAVLIFVSFKTGEKPSWRWGDKTKRP